MDFFHHNDLRTANTLFKTASYAAHKKLQQKGIAHEIDYILAISSVEQLAEDHEAGNPRTIFSNHEALIVSMKLRESKNTLKTKK